MKSIEEMKSEIASAQEEVQKLYAKLDFRSPDYKKVLASVRKAKKRLETLKSLLPYLETNPSTEFVLAQIGEVEAKIGRRKASLQYRDGEPEKSRKKRWREELKSLGVPELEKWLKNLRELF